MVFLGVPDVSMMHFYLLDLLDRYLNALMGINLYMGGKIVLLIDDSQQILPVIPKGSRGSIVAAAGVNSNVWPYFKQIQQTKNMRGKQLLGVNASPERRDQLKADSKYLLDIGDGDIESVILNNNIIEIPSHMVRTSETNLEESVYPQFVDNYTNEAFLLGGCIISSRNDVIKK